MKYVQYVNKCIKTAVEKTNPIVLYGQNIAAGSCLSGLTRGFKNNSGRMVLNTPNIENTQVGIGFGLMLNGISSVFFMKQQDFLLLGIDHLVNTYNFVRQKKPQASFTIITIVVDTGYQGMQSSLNNFGDFCSMAHIPGYAVTNKHDADYIIGTHLVKPGFRIIGVSQRLFNTELLVCKEATVNNDHGEIFQYYEGNDATIVCFNFSFPQGMKLYHDLTKKGLQTSLFSVNSATPVNWKRIIASVQKTKKCLVLDDSKSVNRSCYHLTTSVYREGHADVVLLLTRECSGSWLSPNSEEFVPDSEAIIHNLTG
ncbi:MAG: hypothetical protein ACXAC5_14640 [Promethearchaeota archaeon]|jgi:pyruvate dehydrogenase E1 component beta subunit